MPDFLSPSDAPSVTVDTLVGDDRKFKTPDDLARGYDAAQAFIETLKREKAELTAKPQEEHVEQPKTPVVPAPAISDDDLVSRIREITRQEDEVKNTQARFKEVAETLIREFGSTEKANEVVVAKATELGVSVEFLQEVAGKSPKAFFAQLGLAPKNPTPTGSLRSDVQPGVSPQGVSAAPAPETYAAFEQLRKQDPKAYYSRHVQTSMHKIAQQKGEAFYL